MRHLSLATHGTLDYLASAAFAAAPLVFMLGERTPVVLGCCVASATLLLVSLLTRYPLGALPVIPFRVHGALEFVMAPLLIAYPWIAGFGDSPGPRSLFVVGGAALFVLWLNTDYRAADLPHVDRSTLYHEGPVSAPG